MSIRIYRQPIDIFSVVGSGGNYIGGEMNNIPALTSVSEIDVGHTWLMKIEARYIFFSSKFLETHIDVDLSSRDSREQG